MEKKKGGDPPRRPGGGLGDLGKALREAGILREEQAKQIAHEERVRKKDLGRERVEEEKRGREAELARAIEERREDVQAAQAKHLEESDAARTLRLIREGSIPNSGRPRRFHFVAANGRVPFVDADDDAARQLAQGTAGIVEVPGTMGREHAVVAGRDRLADIERAAPAAIRFWNRERDARPRESLAPAEPTPPEAP